MGITGLLPFLEKSSKRTNINQFAGGTVAIDSYCWLHKGVFTCAEKLSMGQQTDAYVRYCIKFIHMLLHYKIKPILVFDGRHLPAKALTEVKRRENRHANRRKAMELMQMGKHAESRNLLRRSVDVTHEMALELIKYCQKMNIDCIVAPYEADAQLAYLNISGIADVVITEDSDLTLFGCKKVFFKMDINGNGLLVDQDRLYMAMGTKSEHFEMDNFRYMCILSGCDYLSSLPGIGLAKARKFITTNTDCDIYRALTRLGSYLNMKNIVVTKEYRDAFILADITFKHQLVFCPLQRKQVRLTKPTADITQEQLHHAGEETNPDLAFQLALGNCDPFTLKVLHDFDPDRIQNQENGGSIWGDGPIPKHISMWSKDYKLQTNQQKNSPKNTMTWSNTAGKQMILKTNHLKKNIIEKQVDHSESDQLNVKDLLDMYKSTDTGNDENDPKMEESMETEKKSPILIRRKNIFAKQDDSNKVSPSLLSKSKTRLKARNLMRVRRTIIDEGVTVESQFFANGTQEKEENTVTDAAQFIPASESNRVTSEKEVGPGDDDETKNKNFSDPMEIDKIEMEPMDVDREIPGSNESVYDESLLSQCSDYSDTSSIYVLAKSCLGVETRRSVSRTANKNESLYLNCSFETPEQNADSDFLLEQDDINSLRSDYFSWSHTKPSQINRVKNSKGKTSPKPRTRASITRRGKQSSPPQKQQSLLSMYGFDKKKNLKL